MRNKSPRILSLLLVTTVWACKSAPAVAPPATVSSAAPLVVKAEPELQLAPAQAATESLGMSLLVASPMKLVADLDKISQELQLPLPLGQSFLPLLSSGTGPAGVGVKPEALDHLDATRPISVIWLVRGAQQPVGWCAALAFKEDKFAQQSLQALGTATEERAGAKHMKTPSGELVWAASTQRELLLADSLDNLLAGGALAIATQTTPVLGQVLFTINPSIMAKSTGQSLDALSASLLAKLMAELEAARPGKPMTPASKKLTEGMFKAFLPALSQVAVARLSLEIGSQHGLLLRAEMQPTQGSALAEKLAHASPYAFDSALPVSGDTGMHMAWGDMKVWANEWASVIEESSPSGKLVGKEIRVLFSDSLNGGSCALEMNKGMSVLCSMNARPGVKPAQLLEQYVSLTKASNEWEAELEAHKPVPLKIKRSGKLVEIDKSLERKDAQQMAIMKALFGGTNMHVALEPADDRLLVAMGPKAREQLKKYGKGKGVPESAPILKRALLDTAGASTMLFVDVMSLLNGLLSASKDMAGPQLGMMMAAVPGIAELRAPLVFQGSGGKLPALELQIPFGTLQNVARVVSGFMGQMGSASGK